MRQALVTIRTPNGDEYDFRMGRRSFTVGRAADCDLALPAAEVSSRHARFDVDPAQGTLFVTDLDSKNGTFVDDRPLPPQSPEPLRPGTEVTIANVVLRARFFDPDADESASLSFDTSSSLSRSLLRGLLGEAVRQSRARLEVVAGPARGARLVIDERTERVTVGTGPDVDLDLQEPALSGRPLVLEARRHGYALSAPPGVSVTVGSSPLSGRRELRDGDPIRLGTSRVAFVDPLQVPIDELARLDRAESPETRPVGDPLPPKRRRSPGARFIKTVLQPVVREPRFTWAERLVFVVAVLSLLAALGFLLVVLGVIDVG